MKTCTKCGVEKELGEFHKDKGKKDGLQSGCTACGKAYKLRKRYDITPADKDDMIDIQGRCCILCNQPLGIDNPNNIHIDHCHDTGEIRGILCSKCNLAEGNIRTMAKRLDMTFSQVCERMRDYSVQYVSGVEGVL